MDYAASFRRQKASSTDPDRMEREARMVEMNERAKLAEAIAEFQRRLAKAPPDYFEPHLIEQSKLIIAAAEAHLATLPNTKMVEVWRVEVAYKFSDGYDPRCEAHSNKADADRSALLWRNAGHSCVRVTGPHQQEVPA